jgi:hypothetical protein
MQGIQFNPPTRSFSWKDGLSVHLETFELIAGAFGPDVRRPDITRGQVTVFLGHLILAEIAISIRISEPRGAGTLARETPESSSVHRFRKIFASYSHKDLEIVKEMERYSVSLGDRYLRDWVDLRAGERWDERLLGMITEADIFQLFWSWNSSQSPYVAREWRHAFSLSRETFIRPTYWEDPWPRPPEPLLRFQFQRLEIAMLRDRECEIRPAVLERCDKTAATPDSFSEISESVARSRFGGRRFILIALVLGVMLLLAYIAGVFTLPLIELVRGALHF